jgi:type I restriction enzyme, R subunit
MTPEELARVDIDAQLVEAGWEVQDNADIHLQSGKGIAVREYPMKPGHGFADYLLFIGLEAVGVIEAKKVGSSLTGVEPQTKKYSEGLPDDLRTPFNDRQLKYRYESTGKETRFTNCLDPKPKSHRLFTFHRPEMVMKNFSFSGVDFGESPTSFIAQMNEQMTEIPEGRLWPAQKVAVRNLEESIRDGRRRHLIQMATGSGKTYTAIMSVFRMIQFGGARRVLFLVDRGNLGRQAKREFDHFEVPGTGRKFSEIWNVQLLNSNKIDPVARVVITTVQRMYSILKGDDELHTDEEESLQTLEALQKESPPVVYNADIPIEMFDVLIVDECHRSIYNLWRQVLEYFDAHLIGLTATPSKQTFGFFQRNLVMEYGHRHAVADGVNVDYNVFRIRTSISEGGSTIESGTMVDKRDRATREKRWERLDEDLDYDSGKLDRLVVSMDQIRLIIRTWRDNLPVLFPDREHVPKTLVFAKSDNHADDIVQVIRDEFGEGNDFCQKITYRTTGAKPEEHLAAFRNSYNPRVVVTVDMIATGTDVKPIESLLFMRMVRSQNYFEQMKGRGVRIIDDDALVAVTPDAKGGKGRFWIIDAIGVTEEHAQNESPPLERAPTIAFDKLLKAVASGSVDEDVHSTLAGRLSRLRRRLDNVQETEFEEMAGTTLVEVIHAMIDSIDPDRIQNQANELMPIPVDHSHTDVQLTQIMHHLMEEATTSLRNPKVREWISDTKRVLDQTIDVTSQDFLLGAVVSKEAEERCKVVADSFEAWIEENKDEIIALQMLYQRPRREMPSFKQVKELHRRMKAASAVLNPKIVWGAYSTIADSQGRPKRGSGGEALADVVQLVRHALDPEKEVLEPFADTVEYRFESWIKAQQDAGFEYDDEQNRWLRDIADHIGGSLEIQADDFDFSPFSKNGGLGRAHALFGDRLSPILIELNEVLVL